MEILRDAGWQAIIGILGIVVAVVTYFLSRSRKRLVYSIITETSLLSVNDEVKGKIKINYENKDIQNLSLVILRIENRGNVHISSLDFEKPLSFSFSGSELLSAEVTSVSPKSLKPVVTTDPSNLTFAPLLLNKGDYIVVKLVFSTYTKKVETDARIVGIKEVEKIEGERNAFIAPIWLMYILLALLVGTSAMLAFLFVLLLISKEPSGPLTGLIVNAVILAILYAITQTCYENAVNAVKSNRQQ
jgi:hypothetical protein